MTSDQIVVLKRYSLSLVGERKQVGARRKELEGSIRKFHFLDDIAKAWKTNLAEYENIPNRSSPLSQSFAHESSFGEARPPLGRFVRLGIENFVAKTQSSLLTQLCQIASHRLLFFAIGRLGVHSIEREPSFSRKLESSNRQRVHLFQTLIFRVASIQFLEAFDDVKREIDEDAIGLAFDLVIAKEDVGFEIRQSLVNDIHVIVGQRSRRCWPFVFGLQRQNGHVSDAESVFHEQRMTGRHF